MTGRRDECLLGYVSHHSSWQGSANVSRFLFRQQMSADLLFVSKCQQTWFSSANVRRCQHHRSFCTGKNSFSSTYVRKCQQIRFSSADVSRFFFVSACQQICLFVSKCQQNEDDAGITSLAPARHGTEMIFASGQRVFDLDSRLSMYCRTFREAVYVP